jgi:alcohol dehydrogenase class IV
VATLEFRAGTRIVIGARCVVARLGAEIGQLGPIRVAVVADRGFAQEGRLDALLSGLDRSMVRVYALVGVDPDVAEAESAAQAALADGAQAVLGVVGGSALCAAKAVAIRLTNPGPLHRYDGDGRLAALPAPTIAIPTTAGSGSEVSTVVVLHDPDREQHLVIRGHGYEPSVAMLDGTLLASLPARAMIEAGIDALSHCYESLWSRGATPVTDALALAAARTIRVSLPPALEGSVAAMQELIVASAMANLACGNAHLALVHALTSAPGVRLAHGYQNGVLLPHVAAFNQEVVDGAAAEEIACLDGFYDEVGFTARFAEGALSTSDAELMVTAALANPFTANNRRPVGEPDLRAVLAAAGAPVRR